MKESVLIKEFHNDKGQERYEIVDVCGKKLHTAGGHGFKSISTAEVFAASHQWIVIAKPCYPKSEPLF